MTRVTLRAYAKINWGLEILGKRPDGFHELRTVTQTVSLCDLLTVEITGDGLRVENCGEWEAPDGPDNICWRAAELFREALGGPQGILIRLDKRIPAGSGLGGGSSDAVAVLVALQRLTGLGSAQELESMAAELGSDTVLFLYGGLALCTGRGERVETRRMARGYSLVIARPGESVSTRDAYAGLTPDDFTSGAGMDAVLAALEAGAAPGELASLLINGFSRSVGASCPAIPRLIDCMAGFGACGALMTGSGSAVFGLADDDVHAGRLAESLRKQGYWAVAARTVPAGYEFMEGPHV
ncbi:MAG: 4-(cytidine 5'-diphospho)-2-C-methyl-D-erythritol kinase [Armatimonadetes bacterium]|nr:4-(cytidine 5'-diphospho)-2-C-methyl-D-erythritol kinase [Armatimonadota bacterium]